MRNGIKRDESVEIDARVEAVIPNHVKASFGKAALVLQHAVQVLEMKKGRRERATDQHQRIEQWTIRGARGRVYGVLGTYHTKPWVDR